MLIQKKTINDVDVDTKAIYKKLVSLAEGETATYQELDALIGRNCRLNAYQLLQRARKLALDEDKALFGVITSIGLKRLCDLEKVGTYEKTMTMIRRTARRGKKKVFSVLNFDALPNEIKVRHNAAASMFGVLEYFSKQSSVKKIEGAVSNIQEALPIGRTLELFK